MKQNKGRIVQGYFDYSYLSEDTIKKAVAGEQEALCGVYEKYKGYVRYTIRRIAREDGIRLDRVLVEELEQQVWKGLIEDIKKFKI